MKISNKKMEEAQDFLARKTNVFLRERGWELTDNTPSRRWLWKKHFAGYGTLLLSSEEAVEIEMMR